MGWAGGGWCGGIEGGCHGTNGITGEVLGKFGGGKGDDPSLGKWRVMIDEWRVGGAGGGPPAADRPVPPTRKNAGKMPALQIGIGERSPARPCHTTRDAVRIGRSEGYAGPSSKEGSPSHAK